MCLFIFSVIINTYGVNFAYISTCIFSVNYKHLFALILFVYLHVYLCSISVKVRIVVSTVLITVIFIVTTALVQVNTDSCKHSFQYISCLFDLNAILATYSSYIFLHRLHIWILLIMYSIGIIRIYK